MNSLIFVEDLYTAAEALEYALPSGRHRVTVISEGVSLFVADAQREVLIYSGSGRAEVNFVVERPVVLRAAPFNGGAVSIAMQDQRPVTIPADASHASLKPITDPVISQEVQAVMDRMNRNAIIREQAMLRALGPRP